jgi:sulfur carrier protein
MVMVNGRQQAWRPGLTLAELLAGLGVERAAAAVERNEHVVRRADLARTVIEPGDRIEIVRLVGGG